MQVTVEAPFFMDHEPDGKAERLHRSIDVVRFRDDLPFYYHEEYMAKIIIPAGYRIIVQSWENDLDNENTKVVEGIQSRAVVQLNVNLCRLLTSRNSEARGFGNLYDPSDSELEDFGHAVLDVFRKNRDALHDSFDNLVQALDDPEFDEDKLLSLARDIALEILSDYFGDSEFYTRVLSNIIVEYLPEAIEFEDVTHQFMKS